MRCLVAEIKNDREKVGNPTFVTANGTMLWKNSEHLSHRDGDLPARIYTNGDQIWCQNGLTHRDGDKPADIRPQGSEIGTLYRAWYRKGNFHREDGPAVIQDGFGEEWYRYGELHRVGGPAWVSHRGEGCAWYYENRHITSAKEYQHLTGMTDEDMMAMILKYGEIKEVK